MEAIAEVTTIAPNAIPLSFDPAAFAQGSGWTGRCRRIVQVALQRPAYKAAEDNARAASRPRPRRRRSIKAMTNSTANGSETPSSRSSPLPIISTSDLSKAPPSAEVVTARHLLDFIHEQFGRGFDEVGHVMRLDAEVRGDVFQRALIVDTLLDARDSFGFDVRDMIRSELRYLVSQRRRDTIGAWSYLPDYPPLAADADDLAEMIRIFVRLGARDELSAYCIGALRVLLKDCSHRDGSFETWIIPNPPRTRLQHIQLISAQRCWGIGADPEVVANLACALGSAELPWTESAVRAAARYVVAWAEKAEFTSTWYYGPFYGAYAAARCLASLVPEALGPVERFVSVTQREDGGWGLHDQSDILSTSLGLMAAVYANARVEVLQRGRARLSELSSEGPGSAIDFIHIDTGRAFGQAGPLLTYASTTINATFALKAFALLSRF